jgi:hypothetical protein
METPPAGHRTIGPSTVVRLSLADQAKLLGTVIALTVAAVGWMNSQEQRTRRIEESQALLVKQVAAIADALGVRVPTAPTAAVYGPQEPTP